MSSVDVAKTVKVKITDMVQTVVLYGDVVCPYCGTKTEVDSTRHEEKCHKCRQVYYVDFDD